MERDDLVKSYFRLGLQQIEIIVLLQEKHNICISEKTLKRDLQRLGLRRRKCYSSLNEVSDFIKSQIQGSSMLHGYRWMHLKCLQHGLTVKRETVRNCLKELDPVGVEYRSKHRLRRRKYFNKGPNFLWHMDCYDKLKPYGIGISGCIDGFSRHIIWLKAARESTNDPRVICKYFLDSVEIAGGCPTRIRSDLGTENRHTEQMQVFLRGQEDANHQNAFLYGSSPSNQRIEAWWGVLRKHTSQFWMNLFEKMKDEGHFSGSFLDKSLVRFCFIKVLQDELDTVVNEWNTHRISKSRNSVCPSGKPIILYNVPQAYNTKDYLHEIDNDKLDVCKEICNSEIINTTDSDVNELCDIIMEEKSLAQPKDPFEAATLYVELRNSIINEL